MRGARLICPNCLTDLSEFRISLQNGLYLRCRTCGGIYDAIPILRESVEVELDFEPIAEMWSTYHLSDGTRLKMRAILVNAYLLLKPESTLTM